MKKTLWLSAGLAAVVITTQLAAQGTGTQARSSAPAAPAVTGIRVAVVDLAVVERALPAEAEPVEAYSERRAAELNPRRDEIQALKARLANRENPVDAETREALIKEIAQRQTELRQAEIAAAADVQRRAAGPRKTARELIARVAADQRVDLVLEAGDAAVLWHAPALDLTAAVLEAVKKAK